MKQALFGSLLGLLVATGAPAPGYGESPSIGGRFVMQEHTGRIITDHDYRGQYMLLTFGYTYCPDICPTNLSAMARALDGLGEKAEAILPIFITVDPKRDTPPRIAEYVEHFHPRMVGLSGSDEMLQRLTASYKVKYTIHPPEGADPDDYVVDHSAGMYLMNPEGKFLVKFANGIDPDEMAEKIAAYF